jgi:S1-C subfamily serine protease
VRSVDDLYAALDATGASRPLTLSVLRGTDRRELSVSFDADEERS